MFCNLTIQHAHTGKGIPNVLVQDLSYITVIPAVAISETSAVAEYERDQGKLTYFTSYGVDPLQDRPDLSAKWDQLFYSQGYSYDTIFTDTVSGSGFQLNNAIITFKHLTNRLTQLL